MKASVAFTRADKSWTEEVDVVQLTERALSEHGHAVVSHGTWLQLPDSGFVAQPASCMSLNFTFPEKDGKPARSRRAVLGPVVHFTVNPPAAGNEPREDAANETCGSAEEYPFCQCCLLSKSFLAFKELLEGEGFGGMRLFASRDAQLGPQADCRVNREDWETGARALRQYARTWPQAGYEFRKQYVVIHDLPTQERDVI